jgi:hypothetical protein
MGVINLFDSTSLATEKYSMSRALFSRIAFSTELLISGAMAVTTFMGAGTFELALKREINSCSGI